MNYNISKLQTEITSLFNISLDADLSLTYIDEDGDEVALDSDHELNDAVLNQQLNPLRINVHLKSDDISFSDSKSERDTVLMLTNLVPRLLKHASLESVSHSEPFRITEHEAAEMDALFGQSSKSESSDEKVTSHKNNDEEMNPFLSTTAASTSTESNFKKKSGNTDFNSMFLDLLYLASNYKEINEPIETAPSAPEVPLIDVPSNYSMVDDLPSETIDDKLYVEQTLLSELDNLGFKQIALNTEVLRQNQYDLEQTVDNLCDYSLWGVHLSEIRDMVITEHEAAEMDGQFGQSSKSESSDEKLTSHKNNDEEMNPFLSTTAASTSTESNFKNKSGNTGFNSMLLDSLYLANNYKEINEPIETAPSASEVPLIDVPSNYSMVDDLPSETIDDKLYVEQTLLRELDNLGFKQIALNTEVLRQNQYDLEQTVDDLCDYSELGVLLSELRDMGFHDNDLNKKLLILNQGSIKQTVMDLVSRETNI